MLYLITNTYFADMKRLISLFVLLIVMLCNVGAQDKGWNDDIISFITKMYEDKLY